MALGGPAAANPLQERLAWILQGLVVVGIDGTVYFPDLEAHILRLRGNPFGSYKQLLIDVTTMTGMMKYLNGYQNSAGHPNQNYGRELMELFSLGITHPKSGAQNYTETDVREVARSLTGYKLNWTTGGVVFDPSLFDAGQKTFLGQARGNAGIPEVMTPWRGTRRGATSSPGASTVSSSASNPTPPPSTPWPPPGGPRATCTPWSRPSSTCPASSPTPPSAPRPRRPSSS